MVLALRSAGGSDLDEIENVEEFLSREGETGQVTEMEYKAELLEKIREAERRVLEKELFVMDIKENLKYAKSQMDEAIDNLRKLCRERLEEMPLFDQAKKSDGFEEMLRETLLSELLFRFPITGFGEAKKLAVADKFPTAFDFTKRDSDWWSDVKGIGEKMAEEIESCFDDHVIDMRAEIQGQEEKENENKDENFNELHNI